MLLSSEAIENYLLYNEAINAVMFDGQFAGKPLYLDIEGPVCGAIASMLGQKPDAFIAGLGASSYASLAWERQDIFSWHSETAAQWNNSGRSEPPPFSALLCTLSVAAERMRRDQQFESHNYYQRLFDYLQITDLRAQQKVKFAFKATKPLWEELNRWLLDKEGELGRPTAQQISGFPYVSYAVSQALIRDAERQNLHEMFAHFCFAPGEKRTPAEMEVYVDQWIKSHRSRGSLNRLWKSEDLHERIASAACDELQVWDGAEASEKETGLQTYTPTWVCDIETFPPPSKIYLSLTLPSVVAAKSGLWPARRFVDQNGERLLPDIQTEFGFDPAGDDGLAALMPADKINAGTLLRDTFEITNSEGTIRLRKNAGALLPFVRTDTSGRYREVSRVSLLQPHLILCHQGWQSRVAKYLHEAARPGFKEYTEKTLRYLPADWVAFNGVEIVRLLDEKDAPNDLLPLIPLAETSLELQRGMRLADDVWHQEAAPEALAASSNGPLRLELTMTAGNENQVLADTSSDDSCVQLDLRKSVREGPAGAQYAVAVYHNGKRLKQRSVILSSADNPRSLGVLNVKPLASRLDAGFGPALLSASLVSEIEPGKAALSGYVIEGMPPESESPAGPIDSAGNVPEYDQDDAAPRVTFDVEAPAAGSETCVIRGYHYWHCQSHDADQKRWEAKWAECTACKKRYISRNRGKKAKPLEHSSRRKGPVLAPRIAQLEESRPMIDTVFDALCYLGGGKFPRFAEICSQASEEPYFVSRFTSNLSALGHIDIQNDDLFASPAAWRCAPPAVIQLQDGKGVLSGFRSHEMLKRVRDALKELDTELLTIEQQNAPAAYFISEDISPVLPDLVASLRDTHGRQIIAAQSPSAVIALNAPPLSAVLDTLPEVYIPAGDPTEKFDPATGRWGPCGDTIAPGAYRSSGSRRVYAFRAAGQPLRRGTYRLVKIAAARDAGRKIHGYDEKTRQFVAAVGCEPPQLLERALVSCSGLVPAIFKGRLIYNNVGPETAAPVLQKLYG